MSSKDSSMAAAAGDEETRKKRRRTTTVKHYYESEEPDTDAIDNSENSKGTRKRSKRSDTRSSREKQKHSRDQAKEAKRRRVEKANGRHSKPKPPKAKGRLGRHVSDDFYEIDKFLDKRVNDKGVEEYLVRWKDCPESDDTWEPSDNLCDTAFADAERLFEEEKVQRELKLRESEILLGLNEPVDTTHCVKAGESNEVNTPETIVRVETHVPCEPTDPGDEELPWKWNDEEQVVFREVARIDVNDSDASRRVTEAREDGKPVVLVGHKGWSQFAFRWLVKDDSKEEKEPSVDVTAKEEIPSEDITSSLLHLSQPQANEATEPSVDITAKKETPSEGGSSSLLDLSQPYVLDISRMIEDIGKEQVPVVKLKYNEEKPISRTVEAKSFLEHYRGDFTPGGDSTSETNGEGSDEPYLHQWQFPLSDTAEKKLCHQNHPLPNGILREDLLKHWLGDGDSPLQYLFMGVKGTMSKLHRDNGGLAILIAPIVGEKECVLVHRDDGKRHLYHLDAKLDKIDLHSFPLMSLARVWKTVLIPGEILLMPGGTYHQCRNLTPCLSYSRFHLDTVNIQTFLNSMYDGDAKELEHEKVIWNAVDDLVEKVDTYVEKVQKHVLYPRKHEDTPLTTEMADIVKDVRCLRNVCRHIAIRKAVQADAKGPVSSEEDVYTADDWSTMVMEIDMSLHEFRYRRQQKIPRHHPRPAVDTSIDTTMVRDGTRPLASSCGHELERAFCGLPSVRAEDRGLALQADVSIFENYSVTVHFEGKVTKGTIIRVEPQMEAAKLSYEGYPSVFDEYLPYDQLRDTSCGVEVKAENVKPNLRVVSKGGSVGEDYRAVVESTTKETMYYVRLEVGKKVKIDRWLTRSSLAKVDNPLVPRNSSMDQVKQDTGTDISVEEKDMGATIDRETNCLEVKVTREDMDFDEGETTTANRRANDPATANGTESIDLEAAKKKQDDSETTMSITTDGNDSEKSHETPAEAPGTTAATKDGRRKTIDEVASTSISPKVMEIETPETAETSTPTSRIIIGVPGTSSSDGSSDHDL